MNISKLLLIVFSCAVSSTLVAQDNFEDFKKRMNSSFDSFKKKENDDFEAFRRRVNDEYALMVEKAWKQFNALKGVDVPEEKVKPVPPVVYPKNNEQKTKPIPKPLPYDDVVPVPIPKPQPQPVVPIIERPVPVKPTTPKLTFSLFGTLISVKFDKNQGIALESADERNIAKMWKQMSNSQYTSLVFDCLQIRKERLLCDWAYLEMLHNLAMNIHSGDTNSSTMLMAYLYCQSGYKMRLARDNNNKLYMLYASNHLIYNKNYYTIDGCYYYPYGSSPKQMYICDISFPKESALSLFIPKEQKLAVVSSQIKIRQSTRYSDMKTTMTSNLNLMKFYETYPTSMIGENMVSRWAMYANTPMSESVKEQIYPSLRKAISGCDQLMAVNKLLNYVQTGFVYEYDDKVWGHDRAFFAEESLYYPYCDCEDRSILFTRLVRDLVGLDCILIYYPGHLASAVCFTQGGVSGDYILLNGRNFVVADPTYIDAPVGMTMPGMDNRTAKVILLD